MTEAEKKTIRAVIKALKVPRNRFGKLDGDSASKNDLHVEKTRLKLPHGGEDTADACMMVLQALIGEKPVSILDERN